MEITKEAIRTFTFVAGPLVLISYAYALSRLDDKMALWGGIPQSWITYIAPFMFLAAAGWLVYWWVALFQLDVSTLESLRWPWQESGDGMGLNRLFWAYALFLIPSALWIDSTIFHMNNDYSWTPYLVVGILAIVSVANVMYILLAFTAYQDGVDGAGWMLIGSLALGIQVIVNDLIVWSAKFPW